MRVWHPIPVICLDNKRLLGEHVEIHAIFNIITQNKEGYSKHPEVLRWKHHINRLCIRHHHVAQEMLARGMNHKSPLFWIDAGADWPEPWEPIEVMREKLARKLAGE